MNKPTSLKVALLIALCAPLHAINAKQPNVLLIITDDQGYGDFSIHGNPHLQTPHIDQLAAESVQFDRFYVNSFCAPTRAALLTGRWPLRTGCHGVTHNAEALNPSDEAFGFNNGHWNIYSDPVLLRGSIPEQAEGYITGRVSTETATSMNS